MSRRRYISSAISTDSAVTKLAREHGEFAALLYTWMIPHSEDNGCIKADVDSLMLMVIPGFRWKTEDDVRDALNGMVSLGLIAWDEKRELISFPKSFYKYQSYISNGRRAKASSDTLDFDASSGNAAESAQETQQDEPSAQNAAEQRKSAQNASSFSSSSSVLSSVLSSSSVSSPFSSFAAQEEDVGDKTQEPEPEPAPRLELAPEPDTTPVEREILRVLSTAGGGYKYDYKLDIVQIRALSVEFPHTDILAEVKKMASWLMDKRPDKTKNSRLFLRNWVVKAAGRNARVSSQAPPGSNVYERAASQDPDDILGGLFGRRDAIDVEVTESG
jgi:hypothetical protein